MTNSLEAMIPWTVASTLRYGIESWVAALDALTHPGEIICWDDIHASIAEDVQRMRLVTATVSPEIASAVEAMIEAASPVLAIPLWCDGYETGLGEVRRASIACLPAVALGFIRLLPLLSSAERIDGGMVLPNVSRAAA
jgi:hypothetical protein